MRKHHKKWNVVQSGHCTVVLLHLVAATGRQHHCTVTLFNDISHIKFSRIWVGNGTVAVLGSRRVVDVECATRLKIMIGMAG